jgi:8-oxo-dGTP pyrophosphatase MutT (NUDIX family)
LDGEERVLLLEHAGSLDDGFSSIWVPPGGGLEPGESFEQAALRELWEETGLRLPGLGPKLWIRPLRFPVNGVMSAFEEHFFVGHVASFDVGKHENMDEAEKLLSHRWWSLEEIEGSSEIFAPRRLAQLLKPILRGSYPDIPLVIQDEDP